jgi:hypothetical protein
MCGGEKAAFSIRYAPDGRTIFTGGRRGKRHVSPADVGRLTRALQRLDTVSSVTPECAEEVHILTATGTAEGRPARVLLIWTRRGIEASPVDFLDRSVRQ